MAMLAQRLRQTLTLPGGARMGYAEYGPATGRPLFYFHGTPSSRLEVGMWDGLCEQRNLRMVVPDRPGLGLSTFVPNRTIADYPETIAALANHLGWNRFSILGGSGGSPYVLACARFLPPERVAAVGVIAGSGPPEAGKAGLGILGRIMSVVWEYPRVTSWMLQREAKVAQTDEQKLEYHLRKVFGWLEETDREAVFDERDFPWTIATVKESYAQGSDGPAWELALAMLPWGFRLDEINHQNVRLWCGTRDKNTPVAMSRYMATHIPRATLEEFPGLTHYTIFKDEHMETIMDTFLAVE